MNNYFILKKVLTLSDVSLIIEKSLKLTLESAVIDRINSCRTFLENKIIESPEPFYGINTGFGKFCDQNISFEDLEDLQSNLIRSHACGAGEKITLELSKIVHLLKIKNLISGYSGVRLKLVNFLIELFNQDVHPVIYEQGSLGASGDLAPLAHLGLIVIGEGEAYFKGEIKATSEILKELNLNPLKLRAKEGLAIINGTQFSTAHPLWALLQAQQLFDFAQLTAAMSMCAFQVDMSPLSHLIHDIRNQSGQIKVAEQLRNYFSDHVHLNWTKYSVQDPYAFRCTPQVHGASLDVLEFCEDKITREVDGVTDNPNIFPDADRIINGGNFHAQMMAYVSDFMAICLSELGSISERRNYQLVSGNRELPACLTPNGGLHSGMMIWQYTAASIVSQNKQLCTPASVDSIVSSMGQEDHVSMAANAGTKLIKVVNNLRTILSLEWMTACQAMEFRDEELLPQQLKTQFLAYRKLVKPLLEDRNMQADLKATIKFSKEFASSSEDN